VASTGRRWGNSERRREFKAGSLAWVETLPADVREVAVDAFDATFGGYEVAYDRADEASRRTPPPVVLDRRRSGEELR